MENMVPKDERARVAANEPRANQEGLGKTAWFRLNGVGDVQTPIAAIAQQLLEAGRILWRRDQQDAPDTGLPV